MSFDKKAYQREYMREKRKKGMGLVEKEEVSDHPDNLGKDVVERDLNRTETDNLFELDRPGYYVYGTEVKERECWMCGEGYETRMELNKFCGPACKHAWLTSAFGKLKGRSGDS